MIPNDLRLVRNTAVTILALVALRLGAAAWTPLTFDEAYYWMWSKHLAGGYYDHPPGVAAGIPPRPPIAGGSEIRLRVGLVFAGATEGRGKIFPAPPLFRGFCRATTPTHPL